MLLPIVQRELLVASRPRLTYYARTFSAGILLPMFPMIHKLQQDHPGFGGPQVLYLMSVFVFIQAMLSGVFYTSDCLSEEKREGTLGLLFLTDLGRIDIVLGKIVARGLRAFFNLLATFPFLSLSLLVGGVTGQQVTAICVTLVVSCGFSLAAGALVSSRGLHERNVLLGAFLFLFLITFVPLALNSVAIRLFGYYGLVESVYISPFFAFEEAQRGFTPRLAPCLWTLSALSLAFLAYAAWRLKYRLGEPALTAVAIKPTTRVRSAIRNFSPLAWLTRRGRIRTSRILYASSFILLFGFFCRIAIEEKWGWAVPIVFFGSYGVHVAYKFFLTAETARQLNEDRRSGALELLLVTPLNSAHLLRAQLRSTWRALAPAGICVALMNFTWLTHREFQNETVFESALWISIILLLADTIVLPWRAVLGALHGERYPITIFKTFTRTMGPPAALFGMMAVYCIGISNDNVIAAIFQLWALLTILFNTLMLLDARSRLKNFRLLASGEMLPSRLLHSFSIRRPRIQLHPS